MTADVSGVAAQGPGRLAAWYHFDRATPQGVALGEGLTMPPEFFAIGRPHDATDPTFLDKPLHQALVNRPGFPPFCEVGYDDREHRSGRYALRLELNQANVGAFLQVGATPLTPGTMYRLSLWYRTRTVEASRVGVRVYAVDTRGRVLETTQRDIELGSAQEEWRQASLILDAVSPDAAWLGLELSLQQPPLDPQHPLGIHQPRQRDARAEVWFDDITLWQLPRIRVRVLGQAHALRFPQQPRLGLTVSDFAQRSAVAVWTVYDHRLQPVASRQHAIGPAGSTAWSVTPELPAFGWYLAQLQVHDAEQPDVVLARDYTAFLYLPQRLTQTTPNTLLAVKLDADSKTNWQEDLQLLDVLGIGAVAVDAWPMEAQLDQMPELAVRLDPLDDWLLQGQRSLSLSLEQLPQVIRGQNTVAKASQRKQIWQRCFQPMVNRWGWTADRWLLGPEAQREASVIQAMLRRHVVSPGLVQVASMQEPVQASEAMSALHLVASARLGPEQMSVGLQKHIDSDQAFGVRLLVPSATELKHPRRVTDLALRLLYARKLGASQLELHRPWTYSQGDPRPVPDPLLGVFAQVGDLLAGRAFVGEWSLGEGRRAWLFDGNAGGLLAVWRESAATDDAVVDAWLGPQPMATDVWGNTEPVPRREGRHVLQLHRTPHFVTGIDISLAHFRSRFALDEPFIPATQTIHERTLHLHNPWPQPIRGSVTFLSPDGWRVKPARQDFAIEAGGTTALPLSIELPAAPLGGEHLLQFQVDVEAKQTYRLRIPVPVTVALPDMQLQSHLMLTGGGAGEERDGLITMQITNTGSKPGNLLAYASLVGYARQERPIVQLEPGAMVTHTFRFRAAKERLTQHAVWVGVRDMDGPATLNQRLKLLVVDRNGGVKQSQFAQ